MDAIKPFAQLLLPGKCYDTVLVDLNFFDELCLKMFISKSLSYGIMLGALFVKVPQIIKVLAAKSGEGLSTVSLYLEILASLSTCGYGFSKQFPFSSYGDSAFLFAQNFVLMLLILSYAGRHTEAMIYAVLQAVVLWFIFVSGMAPDNLIWCLQASNMPVIAASKLIQAYGNLSNGSTGQLSLITMLMLFFGSLARVFTSAQETGDMTMILQYTLSTTCNGILLGQIFWYWKKKSDSKRDRRAEKKGETLKTK